MEISRGAFALKSFAQTSRRPFRRLINGRLRSYFFVSFILTLASGCSLLFPVDHSFLDFVSNSTLKNLLDQRFSSRLYGH